MSNFLNINFSAKCKPFQPSVQIIFVHICSYLLFVVGVLALYFDTSPGAMNYKAATAAVENAKSQLYIGHFPLHATILTRRAKKNTNYF